MASLPVATMRSNTINSSSRRLLAERSLQLPLASELLAAALEDVQTLASSVADVEFMVVKINTRGSRQRRCVRVTQDAFINLRPSKRGGKRDASATGSDHSAAATPTAGLSLAVSRRIPLSDVTFAALDAHNVLRLQVRNVHDFLYESSDAPVIMRELQRRLALSYEADKLRNMLGDRPIPRPRYAVSCGGMGLATDVSVDAITGADARRLLVSSQGAKVAALTGLPEAERIVMLIQRLLYDSSTPEGRARNRFVSKDFPSAMAASRKLVEQAQAAEHAAAALLHTAATAAHATALDPPRERRWFSFSSRDLRAPSEPSATAPVRRKTMLPPAPAPAAVQPTAVIPPAPEGRTARGSSFLSFFGRSNAVEPPPDHDASLSNEALTAPVPDMDTAAAVSTRTRRAKTLDGGTPLPTAAAPDASDTAASRSWWGSSRGQRRPSAPAVALGRTGPRRQSVAVATSAPSSPLQTYPIAEASAPPIALPPAVRADDDPFSDSDSSSVEGGMSSPATPAVAPAPPVSSMAAATALTTVAVSPAQDELSAVDVDIHIIALEACEHCDDEVISQHAVGVQSVVVQPARITAALRSPAATEPDRVPTPTRASSSSLPRMLPSSLAPQKACILRGAMSELPVCVSFTAAVNEIVSHMMTHRRALIATARVDVPWHSFDDDAGGNVRDSFAMRRASTLPPTTEEGAMSAARARSFSRMSRASVNVLTDALLADLREVVSVERLVRREVEASLCNVLTVRTGIHAMLTSAISVPLSRALGAKIAEHADKAPAYFGVPPRLQYASDDRSAPWAAAICELQEMEHKVSPAEKLAALMSSTRAIYAEYARQEARRKRNMLSSRVEAAMHSEHASEAATAAATPSGSRRSVSVQLEIAPLGADEFFPLHVYVVAHARLGEPLLLKELLWALCDPVDLRGQSGYYLTVFEAALEYLRALS